MNKTTVLYHPAAYCKECDLWSINYDIQVDPNDSMIPGYKVPCDSCDEEFESTEIKRTEHEVYDE